MTPVAPVRAALRPPAPYAILRHALLVGVAGDALLTQDPGLGLPLWVAVLSLSAISLSWDASRVVTPQAAGWLLTAIAFSAGVAWRESEMLRVLDAAVAIGALGMTALSLSNAGTALFARRLRDTLWGAGATLVTMSAGLAPLELSAGGSRTGMRQRIGAGVRATLIGAILLLVFGSLLRAADPIFASLVAIPRVDVDAMISHVVTIFFCAWLVGGWARGALVVDAGKHPAPDQFPLSLGLLDITTALGTLIALFTAFVAVQLGWFFGGERFLQERTGLTAAEYARGGFFQMVVVVLLVTAILLVTRALLRPGHALARRHTLLSLPVVGLLAAIVLSAGMRMQLYVHYYGLTTDRLSTLVFMGWLGLVLVWLTVTVLRGWGRPFVAGAVLSGIATLAALNVVPPDAIVARVNLARAERPSSLPRPPLDVTHLASLSAEAVDLAVKATLASPPGPDRCAAARMLLGRWGPYSPAAGRRRQAAAWRTWNAGESRALRVIEGNAALLRPACAVSAAPASSAPR